MTRASNSKYLLSKRIDALIDRLINKEFRRRLSPGKYGGVTDNRLKTFLESEEKYQDLGRRVSLQNLKDQTRSLYIECLRDFLKSQDIILITQKMDRSIGTFKGNPSMIDYLPSMIRGRYRSLTWLYIVTAKDNGKSINNNKSTMTRIEPYLEEKIEQIAGLVVDRNAYQPMLEAAKHVRRKTREERIHRDVNGQGFEEVDMYNITQYYGMSIGRDLHYTERHIRTDFRLEEVDK